MIKIKTNALKGICYEKREKRKKEFRKEQRRRINTVFYQEDAYTKNNEPPSKKWIIYALSMH